MHLEHRVMPTCICMQATAITRLPDLINAHLSTHQAGARVGRLSKEELAARPQGAWLAWEAVTVQAGVSLHATRAPSADGSAAPPDAPAPGSHSTQPPLEATDGASAAGSVKGASSSGGGAAAGGHGSGYEEGGDGDAMEPPGQRPRGTNASYKEGEQIRLLQGISKVSDVTPAVVVFAPAKGKPGRNAAQLTSDHGVHRLCRERGGNFMQLRLAMHGGDGPAAGHGSGAALLPAASPHEPGSGPGSSAGEGSFAAASCSDATPATATQTVACIFMHRPASNKDAGRLRSQQGGQKAGSKKPSKLQGSEEYSPH